MKMLSSIMWSLLLVCGAMLIAVVSVSTTDYKGFDEYLDYYAYDLYAEDREDVLAKIDSRIEAKEETFDRHRRQVLVEQVKDLEREIPAEDYKGEEYCPEACTCQDFAVRCTSKFLPEIPREIPHGVERLNLAFNKITDIPPKSFDKFRTTLRSLFLHSNEIRSIGNGLFSKMHEMRVLRLSWNKLSGIRKSSLHGLDKVERLYVDNNRLAFIHPLAFRGLTNLEFLQLDGNKLSRLHRNVFVTLEFQKYFRHSSIEYLYLGNNEFTNLPRHIFDPMSSLSKVYLHGNKWHCSCEMKWLKKWIDYEDKYKCKRDTLNHRGRDQCAVCAWPLRLRGKRLQDVPQYSFTCQPPNFSPEEVPATTNNIDPDTLEKKNEFSLFNLSGLYSTQMNLRLDSYTRSMIHASCSLATIPTVDVSDNGRDAKTFSKRYLASFEGSFRCHPEYPTKSGELWELLEPYVARKMTFYQRVSRGNIGDNAKTYVFSASRSSQQPAVPLTTGSISSVSKFLLSDSLDVTIQSQVGETEPSTSFKIHLRTSFNHTHDSTEIKYSKHPWLLIRQPEPSTVAVALALERRTASYRCKAVGQPMPTITWILPSGETLHPEESKLRYSVTRSGRLLIKKAVPEDSGYFQCLATVQETTNSSRDSSTAAAEISTLRIEVFPREQGTFMFFNSRGLRMEYVESRENWSSVCSVQSLPNATTGWITPYEQLLVGKSESGDKRTQTDEGGVIAVANFSKSDEGIYRCVAANAAGRAEYSVFVSIQSNDDELIETIEQPEISTMVFPPNFDLLEHEKGVEVKPAGSKLDVAPTSNITSGITSPNSPAMPPVLPVTSPKLKPDKDYSKYNNFLSTPMNFDNFSVIAVLNPRTHIPGGFIPTSTSTVGTRTTSKEVQKPSDQPFSSRKNTSKNRESSKDLNAPYNPSNLIQHHPGAPPAAPPGPIRSGQSADIIPRPSTASSSRSIIRTTSTTSATTRRRQRPRASSMSRVGTGTQDRLYPGTRRVSLSGRRLQGGRIVPARRVGDDGIDVLPTRRIPGTRVIKVPARSVLEPRILRLVNRLIKARPGDRLTIPCAQTLTNPAPNTWTYRWTLPSGEIFERPGRASSSDLRKFILTNGYLYLASLTARDSGSYTCVATDKSGIVEYQSPITVAVLSNRLEIRDRPIEYIRVLIGDSIAVDCAATGNPRPTVTWRTPRGAIIRPMSTRGRNEVFRNGTLYIHMVNPSDYGAYVCTATNGLETRKRTLVILTSNQQRAPTSPPPRPRKKPTVETLINHFSLPTSGQTTTEESRLDVTTMASPHTTPDSVEFVTSSVISTEPPSTTNSPTTTALTSTTTTSTTTTTTTSATSTTTMTSPDLDDVTMPEEIILFPDEETTADVPLMADITDSPFFVEQESSVEYGVEDGRINFHCLDDDVDPFSSGLSEWVFVWTMASGEVYQRPGSYVSSDWSKFVHKNGSLSLHYLKLDDAGTYTCVGTDRFQAIEYHKEVRLIVRPNQRIPKISNPSTDRITVRAGDSPSIPCDATGDPTPTITWSTPRGTRIASGSTSQRYEVFQNGTLQISVATSLERGSYTCLARNNHGIASRTVVLRVSKRPPRFVDSPRLTIRGRVGERILLSCAASGHPPPRKFWLLPTRQRISINQALFSNVGRISSSTRRRFRRPGEAKYRVAADGTLIINRASERDIGRYHCVISNNAGTAASTINLLVSS